MPLGFTRWLSLYNNSTNLQDPAHLSPGVCTAGEDMADGLDGYYLGSCSDDGTVHMRHYTDAVCKALRWDINQLCQEFVQGSCPVRDRELNLLQGTSVWRVFICDEMAAMPPKLPPVLPPSPTPTLPPPLQPPLPLPLPPLLSSPPQPPPPLSPPPPLDVVLRLVVPLGLSVALLAVTVAACVARARRAQGRPRIRNAHTPSLGAARRCDEQASFPEVFADAAL